KVSPFSIVLAPEKRVCYCYHRIYSNLHPTTGIKLSGSKKNIILLTKMRTAVTLSLLVLVLVLAGSQAAPGFERDDEPVAMDELEESDDLELAADDEDLHLRTRRQLSCQGCRCSNGKRGWFTRKDCDFCCAARLDLQSFVNPAQPNHFVSLG
ncbi:hypothetical protein B566_EDAN009590, partial [Ephemera danica]